MLVISQPTFFPWLGYFDLIDQADAFVILDDAQFVKQSWHQRNKFKSKDGLIWFTAPILSKKEDNLINEIKIFNPERLKKKFISFLKTNYSKSEYFKKYNSIIIETFNTGVETNKLDQLNIKIINCIKELLKIETKIFISSEIKTNKKKSEKIVEICKHLF